VKGYTPGLAVLAEKIKHHTTVLQKYDWPDALKTPGR
jgi:hypothetical protein